MDSDLPDAQPATLLEVLRDLAQMMAEPTSVEGILHRVSSWCAELLPVDGVGVLVRDESDGLMVVTASSPLGRVVEELEAELAEGPCTKALASGIVVPVPDLAEAVADYPTFVPRALEAGVRGIYGIPMTIRSQHVGALDVVSQTPLQLSTDQLATAHLLADVTMSYIANSQMLQETTVLSQHLQRALDSRVVIEQAKGVLVERHGIDVEAAFERIRGHARHNRLQIRDVAAEVTTGALRLEG